MIKLCATNKFHIIGIAFLLFIAISFFLHIDFMWQNATVYSSDGSISTGVFIEASKWLSNNLGENEMALVPMSEVFSVVNPEFADRLISYPSIWNSSGVFLEADTPDSKVLEVRDCLINFLEGHPNVKYVVRDWVDPYAKRLYDAKINDELMIILKEVKVIPFTLSTNWSNKITIYERVQYSLTLTMNFSGPMGNSFVSPQDAFVQYGVDGTTFDKQCPRLGFYVPLDEGINSSKQKYLTLQIRSNVENLELMLVFYYDHNLDGVWSGYDLDHVKSITLSQSELDWLTGDWYTLHQVIPPDDDDSIVQIGIILTGEDNGTITISNLQLYTEKPSK
ncbi:MAG: hypothetical protein NUK63_04525 [Candidatus Bathyarchaeum tardum]|nr:MAG: hypothetical protein NUK63_04525 [Candidatus Bathyarchaeum tardum]